jgi:outer membrane receptor protein involved in Fe transport
MKKTVILTLGLVLTAFSSFAQITGRVVDATTKEALAGATITTEKGANTTSGLDGTFTLKTTKKGEDLKVSYVGYKTSKVDAKDNIVVELFSTSIGLKEVAVFASVGVDRKTPVAISTVNAKFAQENLGTQELPELLRITPSAFVTKAGGGYGDSRINIRGFDNKNIAVLINGVPVNDMEGGTVYFSNWAGIGDELKQIQVQRGMGASKLAIQSIGGTMNIITKTTDAEKGGSISQSLTDFGQSKTVLSLSTGNTKKGAFSFVGSTTQGAEYINNSYIKAYSYFLSYAKDLGKHKIQVIALGAPQQHGQRSTRLTAAEYAQYGLKYNKDVYVAYGEQKNININYFHKPIFSLNDYWTLSPKTTLTTSVYTSFGHGGGSGAIGTLPSTIVRNADGQLLFDPLIQINAASATGSKYGIRNSINNHIWTGALSTLNTQLTKELNLTFGVDGRTYKGTHFREMRELIGGPFFADPFNSKAQVDDNVSSYVNVFKVTPVTNRVAYDYDGLVNYLGTFGQLEYTKDKLSVFAQGALSETYYGRTDRYNATHTEYNAAKVNLTGYNFKGGLNYNLDEYNNVFVNAGKYSRAPYLSFIYNGTTTTTNPKSGNAVNANIKNEEATSYEAGYGFRSNAVTFKLNAYYTEFKNRSLTSPLLNNADGTQYRALITGQGALHKGVEAEAKVKVSKSLEIGAFASAGDWKWKGNAAAVLHDDVKNTDTRVNVYSDGLFVGDQPQTTMGTIVRYQVTKNLDLGGDFTYNDKYYSYYDPSSRTNAAVTAQPYKLDGFGVANARVGYKLKIGKFDSYAQAHVYNLLDRNYWIEANDAGGTSVGQLGSGFKGWGRTSDVSLKINF